MKAILLSFILLITLFTSFLFSQKCYDNNSTQKLDKTAGTPHSVKFNINNISTFIYANGDTDIRPDGNSGFEYPKGKKKYSVFESGIVWGAKVNDEIRVGGSTYTHGLLPGRILDDGTAQNPDDPTARIYRVRPDFATADLLSEINDEELSYNEIRDQYQNDWNEWPAEWGAPFNDMNNDGNYDPSVDIPGVPGASQTIWYVANDIDISVCRSLYGSDPIGVEFQVTIWGYSLPGHLNNVMFKKYKLINKSENDFTDMYISQWSDIDLGDAGDDHLGVDTVLNMKYGYNGDDYDSNYGLTPPAIGFQLLQGPITAAAGETAYYDGSEKSDYQNLNLTSLYFYICGSRLWNDPDLGEYGTGTLQMYAHMQGMHRDYSPIEIPEQLGGGTTKFPLRGNPITGEGWVDGIEYPPCDIRGIASSGPFTMAPGDSQEIVIAQIAAQGTNRLNSVALLKYYANILQNDYPNIVKDNSQISLRNEIPSMRLNEFSEYDIIELNIEQDNSYEELAEAGCAFQGFNIYQSLAETNLNTAAHKILTYDLEDDVANIFGQTYDPNTGYVINDICFEGTNSGIPNIVKIDKDYISNSKLIKGKDYLFGITGYFFNKAKNKTIETPLNLIKVTFQADLPGASYMDKIDEFQTNAKSDVEFNIEVVDPSKLTGDTYEVNFNQQHFYLDNDGNWIKTNFPDSIGKALNKPTDLSNSTLIPMPTFYAPNNTLDLRFIVDIQTPDNSDADSIRIIFPDGIQINNSKIFSRYGYELSYIETKIDGQRITWTGSPNISGEEVLFINIDYADPTFAIDFEIYDDGYSGNPINASGSVQLSGEVGYQFKTEKYWNLYNKTKEEYALQNQSIFGGVNINGVERLEYGYEPVVDGFRIKLDGTFKNPDRLSSYYYNGEPVTYSTFNYNEGYDISDFTKFGFATGRSIDAFGNGTEDIEILQKDYELRFTGEYLDTNASVRQIKEGTGSIATLYGAKQYELANHPLNPNQGSNAPFLIRIPFEVWNIDDNRQVNLLVYHRIGSPVDNPFYIWNPADRMYCEILNTPYDPNTVNSGDPNNSDTDDLTWNLVFWDSFWQMGDIVRLNYTNPIQFSDVYTFTTPDAPTQKISPDKYTLFQNYPNPFNPNTKIRYYIPEDGKVRISIYNVLGQKITEVINKTLKAGKYETEFNGSNFASGVYIYRIVASNFIKSKKMLLLK